PEAALDASDLLDINRRLGAGLLGPFDHHQRTVVLRFAMAGKQLNGYQSFAEGVFSAQAIFHAIEAELDAVRVFGLADAVGEKAQARAGRESALDGVKTRVCHQTYRQGAI